MERPLFLSSNEEQVFRQLKVPFGAIIEKEYKFPRVRLKPGRFRLESLFSSEVYQNEKLQEYKEQLSKVEHQLDHTSIEEWGKYTDQTNALRDVPFRLRRETSVEMCTIAWTKMYEMLCAYPLLNSKNTNKRFETWHLCEAPGAFISATNHFLQNTTNWNWNAISLHPHYEGNRLEAMIDDDRIILETWKHWKFGVDGSGDIREPHNILSFWDMKTNANCSVPLVTADGAISCEDQPDLQEQVTAQLHYCEFVTALGLLSPGGSFVLKLFTCFEHTTISLIFSACLLFEHVVLCKPPTSKSGNKETYLVCMQLVTPEQFHDNFGISYRSFLMYLLRFCGPDTPSYSMWPEKMIPKSFWKHILVASKLFSSCSKSVIQQNWEYKLQLEHQQLSPSVFHQQCAQQKRTKTDEWLRRFRVPPLQRRLLGDHFLDGSHQQRGFSLQQQRDQKRGTLKERLHEKYNSLPSFSSSSSSSPPLNFSSSSSSSSLSSLSSSSFNSSSHSSPLFDSSSSSSFSPLSSSSLEFSSHSSSSLSSIQDPVFYSGFGKRLLEKFGYQQGKGLGRLLQGRLEPVQCALRPQDRQGLGFCSFRKTFERQPFQLSEFNWNIEWGLIPEQIQLSKFCGTNALEKLALYQKRHVPDSHVCFELPLSTLPEFQDDVLHIPSGGVSAIPYLFHSMSDTNSASYEIIFPKEVKSLVDIIQYQGLTSNHDSHPRTCIVLGTQSFLDLSLSIELRNQASASCVSSWVAQLQESIRHKKYTLCVGSMYFPNSNATSRVNQHIELIFQTLVCLLTLRNGGSCCFLVHDILDRVVVGVLRILYQCFEELSIQFTSTPSSLCRWIVASKFCGKQEGICMYLAQTLHRYIYTRTLLLGQTHTSETWGLLQLFSMNTLTTPQSFWKELCAENEYFIKTIGNIF